MKYDKTTILGVGLCVILLLSWGRILGIMGYSTAARRPVQQQATDAQPEQPKTPEEEPKTAPAPAVAPDTVTATAKPAADEAKPEATGQAVPSAEEMLEAAQKTWVPSGKEPVSLTAEDGSFVLQVDPDGGGVVGVVLNDYLQDAEPGSKSDLPVQLGRPELPFCALNLGQAGWEAVGEAVVSKESATSVQIQRAIASPGGATAMLIESWTLAGVDSPYQFAYGVRLDANGGSAVELKGLALEVGGLPPTTSAQRRKFRGATASGIMCATIGDKNPRGFDLRKLGKMKPAAREELRTAPTEWLGVHSQYFLYQVAAPEGSNFSGTIPTVEEKFGEVEADEPWYRGRALLPELSVAAGDSLSLEFHCYAGPKKLQLLAEMPGHVDKVMGIDRFMGMGAGWMGGLTKLLLKCLVGLKSVFSGDWGYGWAIIVITIVVKLIFFPLSHKSTQSMRKMQELQPQLKALREQYKDDPQKMYRKQQELFKENNVSQLGGCLPMLVQIPVFFALYNTFRSAIELRQAGFLWVADLSLPDTLPFSPPGLPIRPLALIMSGSMLLQNKLMPSGEPSQRRMMMFMSLFMLWIFYGMPAGLTLYWTTNQLLTIGQTLLTRRLEEKKKAAGADSGMAATKSM